MKEMPKLGSLTNPSKDILKEIIDVRRHGFDFVEIGIEPPTTTALIAKKKHRIIAQLEKFNAPPIGHTSWWLDMGTEYKHIRRATIQEFKEAIDVSADIGIQLLNIHLNTYGLYAGVKIKTVLNNFAASLRECVRYAKPLGVDIMLENIDIKKETTSFKSYKYMIEHVPGLYIHLDIAHAFICGGMRGIKSFITTFHNKIVHLHIHDNHGSSDEHLGLGEGKINFITVIKELKKIDYDKTITFEVFRKFLGGKTINANRSYVKKNMEHFKKLWKEV